MDSPSGPGLAWQVLTASARGASHAAAGAPNQDAVSAAQAGQAVVAAVADGHGHWRHQRSAKGSKIAVTVGLEVGQELIERLASDADEDQAAELTREFAVPAIIKRWRDKVLADVAEVPFSDAEQDRRPAGEDPAIAYGSTLLLAVTVGHLLVLAQIGDGDVVGVRTDGSADLPVPPDPLLDGLVTTSLCGLDPAADFRVAVVDSGSLLAVLLATDGYGNAQVIEDWPTAFSEDLVSLLRGHDTSWLADQLPSWAARCASADGSADDTTVALLVRPGLPPGSEDTTIPAVIRVDTIPIGKVGAAEAVGPIEQAGPVEPITVRQPAVFARGYDPQEPPAVLARGDDLLEPSAVLARGDDPPEPHAVLARGDDPPEPSAGLAGGDDSQEPPAVSAQADDSPQPLEVRP
jgi:hypothetical protein